MKSPFSDKEMELKFERRTFTFRKEDFEIMYQFYHDSDYDEEITDVTLEEINQTQVYNLYRAKYHLPFPDEITSIREKYHITASKMSTLLGFGVNMYRSYENGEVPSESNARLIQLAKNPESFKTLIALHHDLKEKENQKLLKQIDHLIDEERKSVVVRILEDYIFSDMHPNIYSGFKTPNLNLLKEMVIFFSEKLQPYKANLNHLLFYADFMEYKKSSYSISGCKYTQLHSIGPTLNNSNTVFDYMRNNEDLDILIDSKGVGISEQFVAKRTCNQSLFNESQLDTLNFVVKKFKSTVASQEIDKYPIFESKSDVGNPISYEMSYSLAI